MTTEQVVLLAASGCAAGVINAIAGGGTILTFPALLLAGVNSVQANATSTVALIVGIAGSITGYRRNMPAVANWLKAFAPVSLIGGLIGGILLTLTPTRLFDAMVPFLVLFATILFMLNNFLSPRYESGTKTIAGGDLHHAQQSGWLRYALIFQFFVAVYGGYFGAGIGILMLATLGFLGFHDVHEMNSVKTVLGALVNLIAAFYFICIGLVDWPKAGIMAAGAGVGYFCGAHFAQRISQNSVRRLITLIGLLISAYLFYKQIF